MHHTISCVTSGWHHEGWSGRRAVGCCESQHSNGGEKREKLQPAFMLLLLHRCLLPPAAAVSLLSHCCLRASHASRILVTPHLLLPSLTPRNSFTLCLALPTVCSSP